MSVNMHGCLLYLSDARTLASSVCCSSFWVRSSSEFGVARAVCWDNVCPSSSCNLVSSSFSYCNILQIFFTKQCVKILYNNIGTFYNKIIIYKILCQDFIGEIIFYRYLDRKHLQFKENLSMKDI